MMYFLYALTFWQLSAVRLSLPGKCPLMPEQPAASELSIAGLIQKSETGMTQLSLAGPA